VEGARLRATLPGSVVPAQGRGERKWINRRSEGCITSRCARARHRGMLIFFFVKVMGQRLIKRTLFYDGPHSD